MSIGRSTGWSGAIPFSGQIAEILIFDKALKNADRVTVEQYLQAKYKLTPAK